MSADELEDLANSTNEGVGCNVIQPHCPNSTSHPFQLEHWGYGFRDLRSREEAFAVLTY
jgi:hypothetical protein